MYNFDFPPFIYIDFICVLIVFIISLVSIKSKRKEFVLQNSQKIQKVKDLNKKYVFYPVNPSYTYIKRCVSKKEYDRISLYDALCDDIIQHTIFYKDLINSVNHNKKQFNIYNNEYQKILTSCNDIENELCENNRFFKKIEYDLCDSIRLSPNTSTTMHVKKSYVSPQGRKSYETYYDFNIEELSFCYNNAVNKIKETKTKKENMKYQREIMTDSLRYDVMKRDGFKCVLCGASAQRDGVKLHVDHIKPVSKGGKTELSNLRTLCERCNFGKRDKYDPYGAN